jgi:hypothetical protein
MSKYDQIMKLIKTTPLGLSEISKQTNSSIQYVVSIFKIYLKQCNVSQNQ